MKILLLALVFPIISLYSQKNSDAEKLILKKVKLIKRNFGNEQTEEFKMAFQFLLENFNKSTINYPDLDSYCQTVNIINKTLGDKIQESNIKRLEESQSEGFYNLFFHEFSKIEDDSINKMSKAWNNSRRLIRDNDWANERSDLSIYYDSIFPRILAYYFNCLKLSTNKYQQDSIVFECLNNFSGINNFYGVKFDFLTTIIGDRFLESSWANGEIKLFNYSYLHDYLDQASEKDQLKNLGNWLEPGIGIMNPFSNISSEKIKFKNGKFIDTLTSFKNDLKYSEILFSSNNNNLGRMTQINCFDNSGILTRSRFFEYSSVTKNSYSNTYEYHFSNGKNIDLENLDNKIRTIENLLANYSCDEALKKINDCRNNFPSNLQQNIKLNELNQKAIQVQNSKQQIDSDMTNSKKLIAENKYSEALDVLNFTKNLISKDFNTDFEQYNIVLNQISEVQNLISLQEKEMLEVNSKIENGKKYLAANNYDLALKTFQDARNNNLSVDYSLNTVLDILIKTTQENQLKEIERRELLKLDNAINEGNRLVSLKKYNAAVQLYENARKNNFKNDLNQNKTLDSKISETRDLIKEDLKRKLYENFDRDLDFTKIGKVEISREYLKVNQFTNGDKLDFALTAEEFVEKTLNHIPTYCFYNFDSKFESKGYYYNIFALNDLDGRRLFTDDYRLPFASEIDYMSKIIDNRELLKNDYRTRLQLKDFIYKSNSEGSYNGFNSIKHILNESVNKIGYGSYGFIDDLQDLKHMFWIMKDFEFKSSGISSIDNFFDIDFKRKSYQAFKQNKAENPAELIQFGYCEIFKFNKYNDEARYEISKNFNIENVINPYSRDQDLSYDIIATQIKLVKQRQPINKNNLSPNSTSLRLKNTFVLEEYGSEKKEYSKIQIARDENEWKVLCNKKIPACASFNFDSSNDSKYGKLYNQYVFTHDWKIGDNYPYSSSESMFDLIDLSNLRYSYSGSGEYFYNYLIEDLGMKWGGECHWNKDIKDLDWVDYFNSVESYNSKKFGYFLISFQDKSRSSSSNFLTTFTKYKDYKGNMKYIIHFDNIAPQYGYGNDYYLNDDGYSIRFLKN